MSYVKDGGIMFVGRERELAKLNEMYNSNHFEMAVVYGRRRVGKTTLINEFCKSKDAIYFVGLELTEKDNLEAFSRVVWSYVMPGNKMPPFSDFTTLFDFIAKATENKRIILVIDEFPYLAKANPGISSIIQACIDQKMLHGKLFLILSGSSMSFMEHQVLGYKSPLYGRRTAQFKILPFTFWEARQLLYGFIPEDQALLYGATGGIPEYLSRIDNKKNADENLVNLFFDPAGRLFEEPNNLLKQELTDSSVYSAVIKSIAQGHSRLNEISNSIGRESSATTAYLNSLIELGLVVKETPATEKQGKKTIYTLSDQMFRFWYKFVSPNMSTIMSGQGMIIYENLVKKQLPDFMGRVFEIMTYDYLMILLGNKQLPFVFSNIGRWWGNDPIERKQVEIDIIADDGKQALFAECKWKNENVDISVLNALEHKAMLFNRDIRHLYLFSKSGFTAACHNKAVSGADIRLITFADMCEQTF